MFDTNVGVVVLDLLLILEFWSIALWFTFDLNKRKLFAILAFGFFLGAGGVLVILPGDIALMLGYERGSEWFLSRNFRSLPNRIVWAVGFGVVAVVLRFGKWVK